MSDKALRWVFMGLWVVLLNVTCEVADIRIHRFIPCLVGVLLGEGTAAVVRSIRKPRCQPGDKETPASNGPPLVSSQPYVHILENARENKGWAHSLGFYFVSVLVCGIISIPIGWLRLAATLNGDNEMSFGLLFVVLPFRIFMLVVFCMFLHHAWKTIQPYGVRTTAGKAVGYCFIPFFNFYWVFQAFLGLAKDFNNKVVKERGIRLPLISESVALWYSILNLVSLIPFVGLVTSVIVFVLMLVFIRQVYHSVDGLHKVGSLTVPPTKPPTYTPAPPPGRLPSVPPPQPPQSDDISRCDASTQDMPVQQKKWSVWAKILLASAIIAIATTAVALLLAQWVEKSRPVRPHILGNEVWFLPDSPPKWFDPVMAFLGVLILIELLCTLVSGLVVIIRLCKRRNPAAGYEVQTTYPESSPVATNAPGAVAARPPETEQPIQPPVPSPPVPVSAPTHTEEEPQQIPRKSSYLSYGFVLFIITATIIMGSSFLWIASKHQEVTVSEGRQETEAVNITQKQKTANAAKQYSAKPDQKDMIANSVQIAYISGTKTIGEIGFKLGANLTPAQGEAIGPVKVMIFREIAPQHLETAKKWGVKIGGAYIQKSATEYEYIRDVDLTLSDEELASQFGVIQSDSAVRKQEKNIHTEKQNAAQLSSSASKKIETSSTETTEVYTVKPGDTLFYIAHKVYGDGSKWKVIYDANPELTKPLDLRVGMNLKIPTTGLPRLVEIDSSESIPYKMMQTVLKQLQQRYKEKLNVVFLDIKQDPTLTDHYKVKLVPTQLFIDPLGRELYRHEGFFSYEEIVAKWKELGFDLLMN